MQFHHVTGLDGVGCDQMRTEVQRCLCIVRCCVMKRTFVGPLLRVVSLELPILPGPPCLSRTYMMYPMLSEPQPSSVGRPRLELSNLICLSPTHFVVTGKGTPGNWMVTTSSVNETVSPSRQDNQFVVWRLPDLTLSANVDGRSYCTNDWTRLCRYSNVKSWRPLVVSNKISKARTNNTVVQGMNI